MSCSDGKLVDSGLKCSDGSKPQEDFKVNALTIVKPQTGGLIIGGASLIGLILFLVIAQPKWVRKIFRRKR